MSPSLLAAQVSVVTAAVLLGLSLLHKGRLLAERPRAGIPLPSFLPSAWFAPAIAFAAAAEVASIVILFVVPALGLAVFSALMVAYSALLARTSEMSTCSCFADSLVTTRIPALIRNALLAVCAAAAAVVAVEFDVRDGLVSSVTVGWSLVVLACLFGGLHLARILSGPASTARKGVNRVHE